MFKDTQRLVHLRLMHLTLQKFPLSTTRRHLMKMTYCLPAIPNVNVGLSWRSTWEKLNRWRLLISPVVHNETISLNSRGLGNPRRVQNLRDILWREDPNVVFFQETKVISHFYFILETIYLVTLVVLLLIVWEEVGSLPYYGNKR